MNKNLWPETNQADENEWMSFNKIYVLESLAYPPRWDIGLVERINNTFHAYISNFSNIKWHWPVWRPEEVEWKVPYCEGCHVFSKERENGVKLHWQHWTQRGQTWNRSDDKTKKTFARWNQGSLEFRSDNNLIIQEEPEYWMGTFSSQGTQRFSVIPITSQAAGGFLTHLDSTAAFLYNVGSHTGAHR